jgi:hypothetical protein
VFEFELLEPIMLPHSLYLGELSVVDQILVVVGSGDVAGPGNGNIPRLASVIQDASSACLPRDL